ncbi:MAG TPA: FIST N-terminal domain-containing protein, partial [Stellaceae bacterium]|nr:FIST N-terminal domain-containing protein [Stellaceae bacterium]
MQSAVVHTDKADSAAAGRELGERIAAAFAGGPPDAVVVFASPRYRPAELLGELQASCRPDVLVGASSAGEFTRTVRGEGMACALALRGRDMAFAAGLGTGLRRDPARAAGAIVAGFRGPADGRFPHRCALVMTDALAGHAEELVEQLTLATAGRYRFVGGGAGDNAQFRRTEVFFGARALCDAAVALEILSEHPIGIGVSHGWVPAGGGLRVTEADGMRLVGLNGLPAIEAFEEHAERTGQRLDRAAPIPFFLHNVLGIDTGIGYRLRVPLAVDAGGAVLCAAELPVGAVVRIMHSSAGSAVAAAKRATAAALDALGGRKPRAAL